MIGVCCLKRRRRHYKMWPLSKKTTTFFQQQKMYIIIYTICVLRYYAIRLIETKMPINDIIIIRNIHMHMVRINSVIIKKNWVRRNLLFLNNNFYSKKKMFILPKVQRNHVTPHAIWHSKQHLPTSLFKSEKRFDVFNI